MEFSHLNNEAMAREHAARAAEAHEAARRMHEAGVDAGAVQVGVEQERGLRARMRAARERATEARDDHGYHTKKGSAARTEMDRMRAKAAGLDAERLGTSGAETETEDDGLTVTERLQKQAEAAKERHAAKRTGGRFFKRGKHGDHPAEETLFDRKAGEPSPGAYGFGPGSERLRSTMGAKPKEETEQPWWEEAKVRADYENRTRSTFGREQSEDEEAKAKAEADQKAREKAEADRKAQEAADQKAKEEADRKAREEADRKAQEEAEAAAKAKQEADEAKAHEAADSATEGLSDAVKATITRRIENILTDRRLREHYLTQPNPGDPNYQKLLGEYNYKKQENVQIRAQREAFTTAATQLLGEVARLRREGQADGEPDIADAKVYRKLAGKYHTDNEDGNEELYKLVQDLYDKKDKKFF